MQDVKKKDGIRETMIQLGHQDLGLLVLDQNEGVRHVILDLHHIPHVLRISDQRHLVMKTMTVRL